LGKIHKAGEMNTDIGLLFEEAEKIKDINERVKNK
jgi:hypothetical protein